MGIGAHLAAHGLKYVIGLVGLGGTVTFEELWRRQRKTLKKVRAELAVAVGEEAGLREDLKKAEDALKQERDISGQKGAQLVELQKKLDEAVQKKDELAQQAHELELELARSSPKNLAAEGHENKKGKKEAATG